MGQGIAVRLRYVHEFRDRHGRVRRYFRRPGFKQITLRGEPDSPEFIAAYSAALSGHEMRIEIGEARSPQGTLSAAIAAYYRDGSFRAFARQTQQQRRAILEHLRADHGQDRIALLQPKHVAAILGKMKPFAARNWLKALRGLMQFALAAGLSKSDPTQGFRPVKLTAGTIHTWSENEIAIFEARHPIGSRPRLAMGLLLYTAARRGDAVRLGRQNLRNGRLFYRQQKTGRSLEIPIHPNLATIIEATPSEHLTFLTTPNGTPYTSQSFGNLMRRWCDEAGLPQCSAHGLRKAQARRLAEAGCSAHEIAAITGHKTLAEVQRYTAAADQVRLAESAIRTVSRTRIGKPTGKPR